MKLLKKVFVFVASMLNGFLETGAAASGAGGAMGGAATELLKLNEIFCGAATGAISAGLATGSAGCPLFAPLIIDSSEGPPVLARKGLVGCTFVVCNIELNLLLVKKLVGAGAGAAGCGGNEACTGAGTTTCTLGGGTGAWITGSGATTTGAGAGGA